jgi:hypothetical protein
VYGLKQTTNFEEWLSKPAKAMLDETNESSMAAIMDLIDSDNEGLLVQDFIQTTPFYRRGEPLLFLFLMMEAKS